MRSLCVENGVIYDVKGILPKEILMQDCNENTLSYRWFYPDQTGGPSNTVYWMAKALVKQGHEVTVVTTDFGLNGRYPSDQWVFVDGIKVRYCKNSNGGLQPKLVWHSLKCLLQMDVVHLTSIKCLFSFIIACFAKLKKKK